jgi:hypothetical protein
MSDAFEFEIEIMVPPGSETTDELTRGLLSEIRALDVESASLKTDGSAPAHVKSGELIALGAIVMTLLPPVLPQLISFLKDWSLRDRHRSIRIARRSGENEVRVEYSVKDITQEQIAELLKIVNKSLK